MAWRGIFDRRWVRQSYIVAALYPPTCILCRAPGYNDLDLCYGCAADLPSAWDGCERCAQPLPAHTPVNALCGRCQHEPPAFDRCIAPLRYTGTVPYLITGLKFRHKLAYGRLLGTLLANKIAADWENPPQPWPNALRPQCLLPVPLHPSRLRQRGFNQAYELARIISQRYKLPIDMTSCVRTRSTTPQPGLTPLERHSNLLGAFQVKRTLPACIAIIDDVVTTGATTNELAITLKKSGVQRVEVWAAARAGG